MRLQATGFCKIASASNYVATREKSPGFFHKFFGSYVISGFGGVSERGEGWG